MLRRHNLAAGLISSRNMVVGPFDHRWWPGVPFALIFFCLSWMLLLYPGLLVDEACMPCYISRPPLTRS